MCVRFLQGKFVVLCLFYFVCCTIVVLLLLIDEVCCFHVIWPGLIIIACCLSRFCFLACVVSGLQHFPPSSVFCTWRILQCSMFLSCSLGRRLRCQRLVVVVVVVVGGGTEGERGRRLISDNAADCLQKNLFKSISFCLFLCCWFKTIWLFPAVMVAVGSWCPFRFVSSSVCSFYSELLQRFGKS